VQECLLRQVELFCQTEEKRAEKFLAHSLSNAGQKYNSQKQVFSSKHFRLFYKNEKGPGVEISISKKFFKRAVERNKIRRKIKEIFRTESLFDLYDGVVVFSVFKPFGELSYKEALNKIKSAVDSFGDNLKKQ
tara:strand:+ start:202 stop:600 length:399 start_codon:yes stop_codon:yes gene_type:complete